MGWVGRGAASAKSDPAPSHPCPPRPHPARWDRRGFWGRKEETLGWDAGRFGLASARKVRGEGKFPKKQDTHLRNRRASQQMEVSQGKGGLKRWGCSGGKLAGGQEAPHPLGRGTSDGALAAHIRKQTWASMCRAAPCQCHPPGSPPGPESTWPQHRHVPCSGAAMLIPAHPVSKVVLVLYLSRSVEQAIPWSMHLFSFLFSRSVFLSAPNKRVVAKWSWKTCGFLPAVPPNHST